MLNGTNAFADIKIGQTGTVLEYPAYVVPLEDGRETLAIMDSQDAEIKTLWEAIGKKDIQIDKLLELAETTNTKRVKAEENLKREKKRKWGLGAFGGVAHNGEAVIGVGLVYTLFKF